MTDHTSKPELPLELVRQIDALCLKFEAALQGGQRPEPAPLLIEVPDVARANLLHNLLLVELDHCPLAEREAIASQWRERFPEYRDVVEAARITAADNEKTHEDVAGTAPPPRPSLARQACLHGSTQTEPEVRGALTACPRCHNVVALPEDPNGTEVTCPSCGLPFRLDAEASSVWMASPGIMLGEFELLFRVGSGAFGNVYRARDAKLDRIVAIKIPHPQALRDAKSRERFLREARSVARMPQHPGIVSVFQVKEWEGTPFLISEFVEGITLADLLRSGRLPFDQAAQLLATVAEILDFAHGQGVIHRDIKPSNIMLTGGPQSAEGRYTPHVMDFGLAKWDGAETTLTTEGQLLGTPAYMSPEQAGGQGHRVDGRSDVYSLGVVLYQLLTGEIPFRGSTTALVHQVLFVEPRSPRSLDNLVPRDLETICLRAMAKEPGRRYPTALALAEDLRRFLSGRPIKAHPVSRLQKMWLWCRRNPVTASLAASAILALLGGTISSTYFAILLAYSNQDLQASEETHKEVAHLNERRGFALARQVYAAHIDWAHRFWEVGHPEAAQEFLQTADDKLRGWEWYYLAGLVRAPLLESPTTRGPRITGVSVAADGRSVFATQLIEDRHGKATSWKVTRRPIVDGDRRGNALPEGSAMMEVAQADAVALSPLGKWAAVAANGEVRLWSLSPPREVRTIKTGQRTIDMSFSADGELLATRSADGTPNLWRTANGQAVGPGPHLDRVRLAALSPDGRRLAFAIGNEGKIKVWEVGVGEPRPLEGHWGLIHALVFSPDSSRLAWGDDSFHLVVADLTSGSTITSAGHQGVVLSIAFSPDGRLLASAGQDHTLRVWRTASGQELYTLRGLGDNANGVAFSPDGNRLVFGGDDGTVRVWRHPFRAPGEREFPNSVTDIWRVVFSPDGKQLASAGGGEIGKTPAVGHGEIKAWDPEGKGGEHRLVRSEESPIHSLAYSPDGKKLVAACQDGRVLLIDAAGGEISTLGFHGRSNADRVAAWSVAFSPDGEWVASAGADRSVRVWPLIGGREPCQLTAGDGEFYGVAISPDGKWLAAANEDKNVYLWEIAEGRLPKSMPEALRGHKDRVLGVAFSPDSRWLASCGEDTQIRVWDVGKRETHCTLVGHTQKVTCVAFSPRADPARLVSGSADGSVKVWDPQPQSEGLELMSLRDGHPVYSVAFAPPDGRLLASAGNGPVKVREAPTEESSAPRSAGMGHGP